MKGLFCVLFHLSHKRTQWVAKAPYSLLFACIWASPSVSAPQPHWENASKLKIRYGMQCTLAKQRARYTGSVPVWAVSDKGRTTSFHQGEVQLEIRWFKQEPNDPFRGTFWVKKGAEIWWRIALDEMLVVPLSFSALNDGSSLSWLTATRQCVLMSTDCMEIHSPLTGL